MADASNDGDELAALRQQLVRSQRMAALGELVTRLGGEVVAYGFLVELTDLAGRDRLAAPTHALIDF